MPLRYPCFISYCHGQGDLIRRFIDDLKKALTAYLEPFFDEGIYIDEDRLQPGFRYNEALATALCQSVCMVVVYVPKYGEHSYCIREFAAMEQLERQRSQLVQDRSLRDKGMIIPIVLRGGDNVPSKIKDRLQYADFSKYTTATPHIAKNTKYVAEIDKIARYIYAMYRELRNKDVCSTCDTFVIPLEHDPNLWNDAGAVQYPR